MKDMKLQQMVYALMGQQPGMAGTQGGVVDESPIMENERALQGIAGAGMSMSTWWALRLPWAKSFSGYAASALPPYFTGPTMMGNAIEPNIRDVWLDQLRSAYQRAQRQRMGK